MDTFDQELTNEFIVIADEYLQSIEELFLKLERDHNDTASINELFRLIHSIKGDSGAVGFQKIKKLAHAMEDIIDMLRSNEIKVSKDFIDIMLDSISVLKSHISILQSGGTLDSTEDPIVQKLHDFKEYGKELDEANSESKTTAVKIIEDSEIENEFTVFTVDNILFAIQLKYINEVVNHYSITKVPNVEEYIAGVINLRGNIIPLLDLQKKFLLPVQEIQNTKQALILSTNKGQLGIMVDKVIGVETLNIKNMLSLDTLVFNIDQSLFSGVIRNKENLILVINLEEISKRE
jgi:chemotaxis protein histidine kinase CheA